MNLGTCDTRMGVHDLAERPVAWRHVTAERADEREQKREAREMRGFLRKLAAAQRNFPANASVQVMDKRYSPYQRKRAAKAPKVSGASHGVDEPWTSEEDEQLRAGVLEHGGKKWKVIAEQIPSRTHVQCSRRWNQLQCLGAVVKKPWSAAEDREMVQLVGTYGASKWAVIASYLPGRNGKQCRERWHNQLNPMIKKGPWTEEEDEIILEMQGKYGNCWAKITEKLPGRTDNAVKNHWHSSMKVKAKIRDAERMMAGRPKAPSRSRARTTKRLSRRKRRGRAGAAAAPVPQVISPDCVSETEAVDASYSSPWCNDRGGGSPLGYAPDVSEPVVPPAAPSLCDSIMDASDCSESESPVPGSISILSYDPLMECDIVDTNDGICKDARSIDQCVFDDAESSWRSVSDDYFSDKTSVSDATPIAIASPPTRDLDSFIETEPPLEFFASTDHEQVVVKDKPRVFEDRADLMLKEESVLELGASWLDEAPQMFDPPFTGVSQLLESLVMPHLPPSLPPSLPSDCAQGEPFSGYMVDTGFDLTVGVGADLFLAL